MNISVIHLKHTGTEIICDLIELNEENMAVTIKDPQTIGVISQDENGQQLGFQPFLMSCADDVIHLSVKDILFIAEADKHIAEQYNTMFGPKSPIITPQQKIIT